MISSESKPIIYLLLFVALLILLIVCLWKKVIREEWEQEILENSRRYQALKEINLRYPFYCIPSPYFITKLCSNKNMFDSPEYKFVLKYAEENINLLRRLSEQAKENEEFDQFYCDDLTELPPFLSDKEFRKLRISPETGREIEKEIVKENILYPVTELTLACNVVYTSPGGRNSYSRVSYFGAEETRKILDSVADQQHRKESAEYQRSKMTPTLRYRVMQRDGFRCVLCGRSAKDNVQLHVDHICPVSKGGKTELSNLRTLCQDCNLGKSDKYDPDGIN